MAYDLPAGGHRLMQGAGGYDATVVSGVVTRRHGIDTGARPGPAAARRPRNAMSQAAPVSSGAQP